jgi:hypothetical protein
MAISADIVKNPFVLFTTKAHRPHIDVKQIRVTHFYLFFLGANEAASTVVKTNIGDALVFIDRYYGYLGFTLLTSFFY